MAVNLTPGARADAKVLLNQTEMRRGTVPSRRDSGQPSEPGDRGRPSAPRSGGQICAVGRPSGRGAAPLVPRLNFFVSLSAFCRFLVYFISLFCVPPPFSLCVCLWPAGPPLRCSSASSTPPEQSPSPPPSPPANEGPGRLLGNGAAQPAADSDSEEEFVPNSFLVKSGSGNLCVAANGEWVSQSLCLSRLFSLADSRVRGWRLAGAVDVPCWFAWGFVFLRR